MTMFLIIIGWKCFLSTKSATNILPREPFRTFVWPPRYSDWPEIYFIYGWKLQNFKIIFMFAWNILKS